MAHIIGQSADGPRSDGEGGDDTYPNLILLCRTCHRTVDAAPDTHPIEMLHRWKSEHEAFVRTLEDADAVEDISELKRRVSDLLAENKSLLDQLGPNSPTARSNPVSGSHNHWVARKLDTIVPNNKRITGLIERHRHLLSASQFAAFLAFKAHVAGFEANQYECLEDYPQFPNDFLTEFAP